MSPFDGMYYTMKLSKHLGRGDVKRVRDYLAHAIVNNVRGIDITVLQKAVTYISPYYRTTGDTTEINKVFRKIQEPPTVSGRSVN